jgi:predicted DNA-binding transcriptional regulator YafY
LDQAIRDGRYPNIASLMEHCEVSRRTAYNTLDFLRYSLGAPVEYHAAKKGYYYADPTYALPSVFLQEGEVLAILLAEQVTRQYLGTPLETPLRAAINKISRYLPDQVQLELQDLAQGFHIAGGSSLQVPAAIMLDVQRSIRQRRVLRMRYYTAGRDETTEREVEPHYLTNVRGDWMLVAWDRLRDADRVFMLTRIQECSPLPDSFQPRPELAPATYSRNVFLTEHGWEPFDVVLRFDSYQARWIRERTWHPSQELELHADGGLTLRLRVSGAGDLLRWVLGYGRHVEVLAPDWLRQRVIDELRETSELYR